MGYKAQGNLADFGKTEAMVAAQERAVARVGQLLQERVRVYTPVAKPPPGAEQEWLESRKRQPGTLRDSWQVGEVVVVDGENRMTIDVYTNDSIAPYVEYPTMPHIIIPKNPSGMLMFWDKLGNKVYATIVHHTGTKGSFMMATAIAEVAVMWQEIGADEMNRWAREQTELISA